MSCRSTSHEGGDNDVFQTITIVAAKSASRHSDICHSFWRIFASYFTIIYICRSTHARLDCLRVICSHDNKCLQPRVTIPDPAGYGRCTTNDVTRIIMTSSGLSQVERKTSIRDRLSCGDAVPMTAPHFVCFDRQPRSRMFDGALLDINANTISMIDRCAAPPDGAVIGRALCT